MHAVLKMEALVYYELEKYFLENKLSDGKPPGPSFAQGMPGSPAEAAASLLLCLTPLVPPAPAASLVVTCRLQQVRHRPRYF